MCWLGSLRSAILHISHQRMEKERHSLNIYMKFCLWYWFAAKIKVNWQWWNCRKHRVQQWLHYQTEGLLHRPLQWVICLLHCNELPLRHVFSIVDGNTSSPHCFSGPIGKELDSAVSDWPVADLQQIQESHFVTLPNAVIDDLSSDQFYAYRICWAVILGDVDDDLHLIEVGPIVHSRWLTLGCRILRRYVSITAPSKNLKHLAEFCIKVHFSSWFDIKLHSQVSDGSKNFFRMLQRIKRFPNQQIREESLRVLQRNRFFAHPENILLAMLCDSDVHRIDVNKIRENWAADHRTKKGSSSEQMHEGVASHTYTVRKFLLPTLNMKAKCYYELTDLNDSTVT